MADIVFVLTVGNSTAMLKQNVGWAFPSLHEALLREGGGDLSVRLATISTRLGIPPYEPVECGHQGKFFEVPERCLRPYGDYLELRGSRSNIDTETSRASLSDAYAAFECMTTVTSYRPELANKCTPIVVVQPLETSRVALLPETNPGFVREDALMVVVYAIDTMDCSLENVALFDPDTRYDDGPLGPYDGFRCFEHAFECDQRGRELGPRTNCQSVGGWVYSVQRYVNFFQQLKGPGEVVLAAIGGTPEPLEVIEYPGGHVGIGNNEVCYEGGSRPAARTYRLLESFPPVLFSPKCPNGDYSGDYRPFFAQIGEAIAQRLSLHCLPPPSDLRRGNRTPQCEVFALDGGRERQVPHCDVAAEQALCWREKREEACAQSSKRALDLRGTLEEHSRLRVRCRW